MNAVLTPHLNAYQRFVRKIVEHAEISFLIPIFWRLYGHRPSRTPLSYLAGLPAGTLGRSVADVPLAQGFQLIPHYENHDLKHALLGYGMTVEDELNMQAFMLGNGNLAPTCWGALLFASLMPELWPELLRHFRRGRRVQPVYHWDLADYATQNVAQLRQQIGLSQAAV